MAKYQFLIYIKTNLYSPIQPSALKLLNFCSMQYMSGFVWTTALLFVVTSPICSLVAHLFQETSEQMVCENVQGKHGGVLNHFRQEVSQASACTVPSVVLCHAERVLLAEHQIRMCHSSTAAPLKMTMASRALYYTKTLTKEQSNWKSGNCRKRKRCILFGK